MSLSFEGVSKRYAGRLVIRDISVQFAPGEVTLIAGANGIGKSTLLRLAAGLATPTTGTVAHSTDNVGYLGHATSIYPGLSALQNLVFWQQLRGATATEQLLMPILERVGLARRAHDRAGAFSRGMAQRLNLARLLAQEPDLLLLDEPGTGLDTAASGLLSEEITTAKSRGACIVWVSHDIERDKPIADRVVALDICRAQNTTHARTKRRSGSSIVFDGPAGTYSPFMQAEAAPSPAPHCGGCPC